MENITSQYKHTLVLSKKVEDKIRVLCSKFPNREWSGVLFTEYEGTFEEGLTITAVDLYPINLGNTTFTEYEFTPELTSYMIDNDLLDFRTDIIHSHHTMKTFFSGTDTNTLTSECLERNVLTSLIVNNAGEYTAKIARKARVVVKGDLVTEYFNPDNSVIEINREANALVTEDSLVIDVTIDNLGIISELEEQIKELSVLPTIKPSFTTITTQTVVNTPTPHNTFNYVPKAVEQKEFNFDAPLNEDDIVLEDFVKIVTNRVTTLSLLHNDPTYNLRAFIVGMDKVLNRRFGSIDEYSIIAYDFIDKILEEESYNVNDKEILASKIVEELKQYTNMGSVYLKTLIELLQEINGTK